MTSTPPNVTVLGLGAMGSALARSFLNAGHHTTVWNRTKPRALTLIELGAVAADDPAAAVKDADMVVVSLVDAAAVVDVLATAAPYLAGTTVVELTSMTPGQALAVADLIGDAGAVCVSGAVMVPPSMIGTDEATVLYSGDRDAFDRWADVLDSVAPEKVFVGEDPSSAALLDIAMLDVFYGAVTSFVHAATLAGTSGMKGTEFLPHGSSMLALADIVARELADELTAGVFPGDDNNLAMMLRGVTHVVETAAERGIDPTLPQVTEQLMRRAAAKGHGHEGYGRIAELLRT